MDDPLSTAAENDPLVAAVENDLKSCAFFDQKNERNLVSLSDDGSDHENESGSKDQQQPLLGLSRSKKQRRSLKCLSGLNCCSCCYRSKRCCFGTIGAILLVVVIVVLLLWFVFVPKIVASKVQQSRLVLHNVHMARMLALSADISTNMSIVNLPNIGYDVLIDAADFTIRYNGTDMAKLPMPDLHIEPSMLNLSITVSSELEITNRDQWALFARDMMTLKKFTWEFTSNVIVTIKNTFLGTIRIQNVYITLPVELPALDNLATLNVVNFDLPASINWPISAKKSNENGLQGIQLDLDCVVENPTPITLSLGDITFALRFDPRNPDENPDHKLDPFSFEDSRAIGIVIARSLTLKPGKNVLKLIGAITNPVNITELNSGSDVASVRSVVNTFVNRVLSGAIATVGVQGWSVCDEFIKRFVFVGDRTRDPRETTPFPIRYGPDWLATALQNLKILVQVAMPESKGRVTISNVGIKKINIKLRSNIQWHYKPVVAATISAHLSVPFLFGMNVSFIRQRLTIFQCTGDLDGPYPCGRDPDYSNTTLLGNLESQWGEASTFRLPKTTGFKSGPAEYALIGSINNSTGGRQDSTFLNIPRSSFRHFQSFIRDLIEHSSLPIFIRGEADALVISGFGEFLEIDSVPFQQVTTLEGMSSFRSPNMMRFVNNLDVTSVRPHGLLYFSLLGAYMKKMGDTGQVGVEVESPMEFELHYHPIDSENQRFDVGRVVLPSLNLGDTGACRKVLQEPLRNRSWTSPDMPYCEIAPYGSYQAPSFEVDREECTMKSKCPGRAFLSSYLSGGPDGHLRLSLTALTVPPELTLAKKFLSLDSIDLPSYTYNHSDLSQAPLQFVHSVLVHPNKDLFRNRLWLWLEFYNPFQVPLRYYYIHVATLFKGRVIGHLHVNLTQYDPFVLKKNYTFRGYPTRPTAKGDEYGPHPSDDCIAYNDCQRVPIDVPSSVFSCGDQTANDEEGQGCSKTIRSNRLQVSFRVNPSSAILFWKSLINRQNDTELIVQLEGKVLVGIGKGLNMENTDEEPDDVEKKDVVVTWLDFRQLAKMVVKKFE